MQEFVEKNLWQILLLLVGLAILYATIASQVRANDERIDGVERKQIEFQAALIGITNNQTQILLLQQNDATLKDDIIEIKQDIREIKELIR